MSYVVQCWDSEGKSTVFPNHPLVQKLLEWCRHSAREIDHHTECSWPLNHLHKPAGAGHRNISSLPVILLSPWLLPSYLQPVDTNYKTSKTEIYYERKNDFNTISTAAAVLGVSFCSTGSLGCEMFSCCSSPVGFTLVASLSMAGCAKYPFVWEFHALKWSRK